MASSANPERRAEDVTMVKWLMMKNALFHRPIIDARTALLLQKNGLARRLRPKAVPKRALEILNAPDHPDRVSMSAGPMICYREGRARRSLAVLSAAEYMFSASVKARDAAVSHFERLAERDEGVLTQRSRVVIAQFAEPLRSRRAKDRRNAAVVIHDAIDDDFYCNLAGLRQCLQVGVDPTDYLQRVFRASASSLNALGLSIVKPSERREEIAILVQRCAQAASLREACDLYYKGLGHLPLAPDLSLGQAVTQWIDSNGSPESVWEEVWGWADSISSPLARYHACCALARRPAAVPHDQFPRLWQEILAIADMPAEQAPTSGWTGALALRCELAKHYVRHIETNFPGMDGERISASAWWLTERVASIFGTSDDAVHNVRNSIVAVETNRSGQIHMFAHPPILPSALRGATVTLPSVWSHSLLCQIGPNLTHLRPDLIVPADLNRLVAVIVRGVLIGFPTRSDQVATYAFEQGIAPATHIWERLSDGAPARELLKAVALAPKPADSDELSENWKGMINGDSFHQYIAASNLRGDVYAGDVPVESVWEWLSEESWRTHLLIQMDMNALDLLLDAVLELQVQNGGKWHTQLPHILAIACKNAYADEERRRLLFLVTAVSSLCSDTVSAIRRLLQGRGSQRFLDEVAGSREQIESLRDVAPPWVYARARQILAALAKS